MFTWVKNLFKRTPKIYLHDVDINKWEYLGYSEIYYYDVNNTPTTKADVVFFCKKGNILIRQYKIITNLLGGDDFKTHVWINRVAEMWKINELNLVNPILNQPSKWAENWTIQNHNMIWNAKLKSVGNKWETSSPEIKSENNVVTVKFRKEQK